MHVIIWEFTVRPEQAPTFEATCGPGGAWVRLFRGAPGYLGTELLAAGDSRYLTLHHSRHSAAFERFRHRAAADYQALDTRCRALAAGEREIGAFDSFGEGKKRGR